MRGVTCRLRVRWPLTLCLEPPTLSQWPSTIHWDHTPYPLVSQNNFLCSLAFFWTIFFARFLLLYLGHCQINSRAAVCLKLVFNIGVTFMLLNQLFFYCFMQAPYTFMVPPTLRATLCRTSRWISSTMPVSIGLWGSTPPLPPFIWMTSPPSPASTLTDLPLCTTH